MVGASQASRRRQRGSRITRHRHGATNLFYLARLEDVPSFLDRGIVPPSQFEVARLCSDDGRPPVLRWRAEAVVAGRRLGELVELFFQPRNPVLYRSIREAPSAGIAVMSISPRILEVSGLTIADGNATAPETKFFAAKPGLKVLAKEWTALERDWWRTSDGSKRRISAECLFDGSISSDLIEAIQVRSHAEAGLLAQLGIRTAVLTSPELFFAPCRQWSLTDTVNLLKGDIFFSQKQTLGVTVNTVGVMGRGIAERAKLQFPDVYVEYQDACRRKRLKIGKPFLYKRESRIDWELADDPRTLVDDGGEKWFLLFPTKKHWREMSNISEIDDGLEWLAEHATREGIESLAIPALGCGHGGLEWKDVGPLICRRLVSLGIPVDIYLPRATDLPASELSADYLLGPGASKTVLHDQLPLIEADEGREGSPK